MNAVKNTQKESVSVILLAAGEVLYRLPSLMLSCSSPALIPIHTKPVAQHLIEFYHSQVDDIFLIVEEKVRDEVVSQLGHVSPHVKVFGVPKSRGVGATLAWALENLSLKSEVIVNIATTLPNEMIPPDSIGAAQVPGWQLSLLAKVSQLPGEGVQFYGRDEPIQSDVKAFTGVFRCSRDILSEQARLFQSSNDLVMAPKTVAAAGGSFELWEDEWIDCGHDANLPRARANVITSRSFNTLEVDQRQGTIRKSSSNLKKIRRERDYYQNLPLELEVHFPRLRPNPEDPGNETSYVMEYVGYPNLAELALCWKLPDEAWWRLFEGLSQILNRFRNVPAPLSKENYLRFFVAKTERRIEEYLASLSKTERLSLEGNLTLNQIPLLPLETALEGYRSLVEDSFEQSALTVFHGDLCFNNILYGWSGGIIRLIDPRGRFDDDGIYGDFRYDLAKINHSACGNYDLFVANRFELNETENGFTLKFTGSQEGPRFSEMMSWLIKEQGVDERFVQAITGSLFLSMCPLHAEDPIRQKAFFVHGRRILSELFS